LHIDVATIVRVVGLLLNGLAVQMPFPSTPSVEDFATLRAWLGRGVNPDRCRSDELIGDFGAVFAAPSSEVIQPALRQGIVESDTDPMKAITLRSRMVGQFLDGFRHELKHVGSQWRKEVFSVERIGCPE